MTMNKMGLLAGLVLLLAGCASGGGNIPVVDSGRDVSNEDMQSAFGAAEQWRRSATGRAA